MNPVNQHHEGDVALYVEPERFQTYAYRELLAAPPWRHGFCFHPDCGRAFYPNRDWQIYCSSTCERAAVSEFRKWGHKVALPLLVGRIGKHAPGDSAQGELTRAARRYVTRMQTTWMQDRRRRANERGTA